MVQLRHRPHEWPSEQDGFSETNSEKLVSKKQKEMQVAFEEMQLDISERCIETPMPLVPRTSAELPSESRSSVNEPESRASQGKLARQGSLQNLTAWLPFNIWTTASSSTAEARTAINIEEDVHPVLKVPTSTRSTDAPANVLEPEDLSQAALARHNLLQSPTKQKPDPPRAPIGYPAAVPVDSKTPQARSSTTNTKQSSNSKTPARRASSALSVAAQEAAHWGDITQVHQEREVAWRQQVYARGKEAELIDRSTELLKGSEIFYEVNKKGFIHEVFEDLDEYWIQDVDGTLVKTSDGLMRNFRGDQLTLAMIMETWDDTLEEPP